MFKQIAVPSISNGRVGAIIAIVTETEYNKHYEEMVGDTTFPLIPVFYIEEYLKRKGLVLSDFKFESAKILEKGVHLSFAFDSKTVVSTLVLVEILKHFSVPHNDFIDSYASYLKSQMIVV